MSAATVTLIAAVVASIVGFGTFIHLFLMVLRWPTATGTVVGNTTQARSTQDTQYAHFPIIEFTSTNGQRFQVNGDIGLSEEWPIGKKLELRYRSSNPNHTTTMKGWQRLLFSAVFIGFAIVSWYAWLTMEIS